MSSYQITIYVEDISTVVSLFSKVRIYRSITGSEANRVLYDSFDLVPGQSSYEWTDTNGSATYVAWFTYFNSSTLVESGFSDPIQYGDGDGEYVPGFYFSDSTYPEEYSLSLEDVDNITTIRYYTGDPKSVKRDYVSPTCDSGYENVSVDGKTYRLSDPRGWPLKVVIDGSEYSSLADPAVNDYEYVTFSGAVLSTVSGVIDIWYEKFRHSDREILKVFTDSSAPPYVSAANVTDDMSRLQAAIIIIRSEIAQLMGETSGSFNLQGELSFNPEPLLRQKKTLLDELQGKLDDLVEESSGNNITGVRID